MSLSKPALDADDFLLYDGGPLTAAHRAATKIRVVNVVVLSPFLFQRCQELQVVHLDASVLFIGASCFAECRQLRRVLFGPEHSHLTAIGEKAFWRCSSLTHMEIPPSCQEIHNYAFGECAQLTTVTFVLPRNKTTPPALTHIHQAAFYSCQALACLENLQYLPNLRDIGPRAFIYCRRLTSLSLPANTVLRDGAFQYCTALRDVQWLTRSSSSDDWDWDSNDGSDSCHIKEPQEQKLSSKNVFWYCPALQRITMDARQNVGGLFHNCTSLTTVELTANQPPRKNKSRNPDSCLRQCSSNSSSDKKRSAVALESPSKEQLEPTFHGCHGLQTVILPQQEQPQQEELQVQKQQTGNKDESTLPIELWPRLLDDSDTIGSKKDNDNNNNNSFWNRVGIPQSQRPSVVYNFLRHDENGNLSMLLHQASQRSCNEGDILHSQKLGGMGH